MKELLIKIKALFEGSGANQAATAVKQVGDAADQAKGKTGGLAGAFGDSSAKAGIFAGATAALGGAILGLAQQALSAAVDAVKQLVSAFIEGIGKAAEFAGAMTDLSARTGQPIEQLVVLKRAFENAGMSADAVGPMLNRLQKALAGVNEDGQPTSDILNRLGLSVASLNQMTATQQLEAIAAAISKLPTPAAQAAASMEIFGKSGGQMLALLKDGSAFATAAQQVGSLGANTQQAAAALDTFSDAMGALDDKKMGFFMAASAQFATELERAGVAINQIDLGPLGEQVGYVVRGAIEVTKELTAWVDWFRQISDAIGVTQPLIDALGQAIRMAFDPLNLTGFLTFLRDTGQAAVETEAQQKNVEEANRRIANSAEEAAATIARIRAESQGVSQEAVQSAVPVIGNAANAGSAQIASSGQTAQQGIADTGTKAAETIRLTADQLRLATQQIAQSWGQANSSSVTPAISALVQSVQEGFARIAGEFTTAMTNLNAAHAQNLVGLQTSLTTLTQTVNAGNQALAAAFTQSNTEQTAAFTALQTSLQTSLAGLSQSLANLNVGITEATTAATTAATAAEQGGVAMTQAITGIGAQITSAAQAAAQAAQSTAGQINSAISQVGSAIAQNNSAVASGFAALSNRISAMAASLQSQINYLAARR